MCITRIQSCPIDGNISDIPDTILVVLFATTSTDRRIAKCVGNCKCAKHAETTPDSEERLCEKPRIRHPDPTSGYVDCIFCCAFIKYLRLGERTFSECSHILEVYREGLPRAGKLITCDESNQQSARELFMKFSFIFSAGFGVKVVTKVKTSKSQTDTGKSRHSMDSDEDYQPRKSLPKVEPSNIDNRISDVKIKPDPMGSPEPDTKKRKWSIQNEFKASADNDIRLAVVLNENADLKKQIAESIAARNAVDNQLQGVLKEKDQIEHARDTAYVKLAFVDSADYVDSKADIARLSRIKSKLTFDLESTKQELSSYKTMVENLRGCLHAASESTE